MASNFYATYVGNGPGGGSGGVTSFNGETGAITLTAGAGISLTSIAQAFTISALQSSVTHVSASGVIALTAASPTLQVVTGSHTQVFNLPDATTLQLGWTFTFNNLSNSATTIQNNSGTPLYVIPAGGGLQVQLYNKAFSTGLWNLDPFLSGTPVAGGLAFVDTAGGWDQLPIGTTGQVLTVGSSGLPEWDAGGGGSTGNYVFSGSTISDSNTGAAALNFTGVGAGFKITTADSSSATAAGDITLAPGINTSTGHAGNVNLVAAADTGGGNNGFVNFTDYTGAVQATVNSVGDFVVHYITPSRIYASGGGYNTYDSAGEHVNMSIFDGGPNSQYIGATSGIMRPFIAGGFNQLLMGYNSSEAIPTPQIGQILVKTGNPLHLEADYIWLDGQSSATYAKTNIGQLVPGTAGGALSVAMPGTEYAQFTADSGNPAQMILVSSQGTIAAPTSTLLNDALGQWQVYGYGTSAQEQGATVTFSATENWTNSSVGTSLAIATALTGTGGPLNTFQITGTGSCVLGGDSTTPIHRLNTATGTPAGGVGTLTNLPTGLAGNPTVWLTLDINGTDYVFPGWTA